MKKKIYHGSFTYRYKYQYYTPKGQAGAVYGPYSGVVDAIYLEGKEDAVWDDILKGMGSTKTKQYSLVEKEIKNVQDVGETMG